MLAHARPDKLERTLQSLLAVRQVDRSQVFVVQDGKDRAVEALVRELGLKHVRARPAPSADNGAAKVAAAYKWALSHAFDFLTRDEALVVVEDDLLFAPDLMEWFLFGWSAMRADASLWCVSAWHDNGLSGLVREPKKVLRTEYFPGLGWLLSRKLYKEELEEKWPNEHWDHWMRSETVFKTSRGRECVVPEVPRTFHNGNVGTFMDQALHDRYFADIALNTDGAVGWPPAEWPALVADAVAPAAYEARLRAALGAAAPLRANRDGLLPLGDDGGANGTAARALWYSQKPRDTTAKLFDAIAEFVGIWHEMRRGAHKGVHELWCGGRRLYLVNTKVGPPTRPSPYKDLAPKKEAVFATADAFTIAVRRFEAKHGRSPRGHCRAVRDT